jgi:hypothetical protein
MARSSFRPSGQTEVKRLRQQLDETFLRADQETSPGTDLEGDINRYLCIRISGFLEQAVGSCCRALVEVQARENAVTYALSHLDKAPNPRAERLVQLVRRFSSEWADELDNFLSAEERRSRVNALMGIRNDVAHGKNQGVSRRQAYEYYSLVDEVVDWFLQRFDPLP